MRDHAAAWVSLVPELAAVVTPSTPLPADVDLQRRQAYDAVAAVLRRLALDQPVLLTVDDLQDGGAATVDLLGYLAGRLGDARVLVVAAVRAEDAEVAARLADRAAVLRLGALPRSAVDALAAAAGLTAHGEQVMARTAGHPLSVVEYLRALAQGDAGVPESLADAVLDPRRAARRTQAARWSRRPRCCAAASTRPCWPRWWSRPRWRRRAPARSWSGSGCSCAAAHHYEFANDLLQECVHAALPPALSLAYHRRAADLTSDRPEMMAEHAHHAGDEPRAAQGWLLAGEAALHRAAVEDALGLLDRSLAVETSFAGTRARALLARGSGPRGPHGLRRRPRRRRRGAGAGPDDRRPPPGDGGPALPRRGRRGRTRAHGRRAGRTRWRKGSGWPPTSATAGRRPTSAAGSPSSKPAGSA